MFFSFYIQLCFICRPSDSTAPTDDGIEPRTVATRAWQSYALITKLDLIRKARSHSLIGFLVFIAKARNVLKALTDHLGGGSRVDSFDLQW